MQKHSMLHYFILDLIKMEGCLKYCQDLFVLCFQRMQWLDQYSLNPKMKTFISYLCTTCCTVFSHIVVSVQAEK